MKTILRKTAHLFFALLIPATILIGCQEDLTKPSNNRNTETGQPDNSKGPSSSGTPKKGKIVNPND